MSNFGRGGFNGNNRYNNSERGGFSGNRGGNNYGQNRGGGRGGYNSGQNGNRGGYNGGNFGQSSGRGGASRGGGRPTFTKLVQNNTSEAVDLKNGRDIHPKESENIVFNAKPLDLSNMSGVLKYSLMFNYTHPRTTNVIDLSRDRDNDCNRNVRRKTINALFQEFLQHDNFNSAPDGVFFAYDRVSTLYSNYRVEHGRYQISTDNLDEAIRRDVSRVEIVNGELGKPDKVNIENFNDVSHFLEVLMQQSQYQMDMFGIYSGGVYNFETLQDFRNAGFQIAQGHHKNVTVCDENNALMFINPKKAIFHRAGSLLEYLHMHFGIGPNTNYRDQRLHNVLKSFLKHLYVYPVYNSHRRFKIDGLTQEGANDITFDYSGMITSVQDYMLARHQVQLNFPKIPCIESRLRGNVCYYPMECLQVIEGQRVMRTKMTPENEGEFIRQCQLQPQNLMHDIENQLSAARLAGNNISEDVRNAGVRIGHNNYEQECSVLYPPQIEYGKGAIELVAPASDWRMEREIVYKKGAEIQHLLFLHLNMNVAQSETFRKKLLDRAAQLGIRIHHHECMAINLDVTSVDQLIDGIGNLKEGKMPALDFVMLLGDVSNGHNHLKAAELYSTVVTQQVMLKTITNPKLGDVTITNILNKMNLKAGGINFGMSTSSAQLDSLHLRTGNVNHGLFIGTMVFGLDMSALSPISNFEKKTDKNDRLYTYGYAFTTTIDGNTTGGGYFYSTVNQPPLSFDLFREPLSNALEEYRKVQNCFPKFIVFYRRGGDTETTLDKLDDEYRNMVDALKSCMEEKNETNCPGTLYMAITRQHNVRMARKDGNNHINVQPGTCVDSVIVQPENEFIMVPHSSPLGTAKPFKAIVVNANRIPFSLSAVKQMTMNLCFNFEIVTKSINLPTPLRCAGLFAERGRNNYNVCKDDLTVANNEISDEYAVIASQEMRPSIKTRFNA